MKSVNLLPVGVRYDFEKQYLIKGMIYFLFLNIVFFGIVITNNLIEVKLLNKLYLSKTKYVASIQHINSNFMRYNTEYDGLKQRLSILKEKEKTFFSHFKLDFSPLVSTVIHLDSIKKGVYISKVEYTSGVFIVEGFADKSVSFYNYYKSLENNNFIKDLDFNNITSLDDNTGFSFKVKYSTRNLNEIF